MAAGFVLVGGRSSRMGRDKALLPFEGKTLGEYVAGVVLEAAGSVALIGDPSRYSHLGFPVVADSVLGCGPLGGIEAALCATHADWNLIVACDMPGVPAAFLRGLVNGAAGDCVLARGPSARPEPLCAVYHRRCLPDIREALARGVRKVTDGLASLDVRYADGPAHWFANVNTPEDWTLFSNA